MNEMMIAALRKKRMAGMDNAPDTAPDDSAPDAQPQDIGQTLDDINSKLDQILAIIGPEEAAEGEPDQNEVPAKA